MVRYKLIRITENSMEPTLTNGQIYLMKRFSKNNRKLLKRKDIVVFKEPVGKNKNFVKRIIGLPGETVQILNTGVLLVNKETINTEFELYSSGIEEIKYEWILGPKEYVLLGDNREDSIDSRRFGAISEELLIGKVSRKIWPLFE